MLPDLFNVGPFSIHTYGLFIAIAFIIGLMVAIRLGKSEGMDSQKIMDLSFLMMIWAILGSRAMYILINFSYFKNHPLDIFKIWEGGLVFSGGLIAVVMVMIWYLKQHHIPFWKIGDLYAPALALGQAIGRIGCFMAGCCYGKPTDLPWAVIFSHPKSLAPQHLPLHPTQLYETGGGLIIFIVLLFIHAKKKFEGQVFIWFLILHSTMRLFVERFRGDDRGIIPGTQMSVTQLLTIIILIIAVIALMRIKPPQSDRESK